MRVALHFPLEVLNFSFFSYFKCCLLWRISEIMGHCRLFALKQGCLLWEREGFMSLRRTLRWLSQRWWRRKQIKICRWGSFGSRLLIPIGHSFGSCRDWNCTIKHTGIFVLDLMSPILVLRIGGITIIRLLWPCCPLLFRGYLCFQYQFPGTDFWYYC